MGAGQGLSLAVELMEMILEDAHVCDVLRCRQLSKTICELIDNSPSLQYRIELLLSGMEDTGFNDQTVSENREILREYLSRWTTLRPDVLVHTELPLGEDPVWTIKGDLFCQVLSSKIDITLLPSRIRDAPSQRWSSQRWSLPMVDSYAFEVDVSQDLVLFQYREGNGFCIKALSLSSGEKHPGSTCDAIVIETSHLEGIDELTTKLVVLKDEVLVGVYPMISTTCVSLSIVDWRTGATIWTLAQTEFTSFLFLDDAHILTSSINRRPYAPKISIINFRISHCPTISLLFPNFLRPVYEIQLTAGQTPPSTTVLRKRTTYPFQITTSDKIFTLAVFGNSRSLPHFVVPSWVLKREIVRIRQEMSSASEEEVVVPWNSWGPRGTAFFPDISRTLFADSSLSASGMIYITKEAGSIVLYDFNRFALRRDASLGETDVSIIGSSPHEVDSALFKEPITTRLLWRKFVTQLKVDADAQFGVVHDSFLMCHGMRRIFQGGRRRLEVISF
ncbi:hypothetical protein NLI96_g3905 [Meripilus lineatus]|uniref:F-box domain-containing protein n=1 Tax=Meripilus lineatus TaxID=2056292 RepID=A0AAD5VAT4_9APHY|nr:hypothetical protein NLI96_g3905 [Physisporinus lineatus]